MVGLSSTQNVEYGVVLHCGVSVPEADVAIAMERDTSMSPATKYDKHVKKNCEECQSIRGLLRNSSGCCRYKIGIIGKDDTISMQHPNYR
jgi:hypothetical protein